MRARGDRTPRDEAAPAQGPQVQRPVDAHPRAHQLAPHIEGEQDLQALHASGGQAVA